MRGIWKVQEVDKLRVKSAAPQWTSRVKRCVKRHPEWTCRLSPDKLL